MQKTPSLPGRVRVKVCGITRPVDAEALDALGVDYLGFNFFSGSQRYVDPEKAAAMIARLRRAEPVGIFVDENPARVAAIAALTGIRMVQLHGNEDWKSLDKIGLPIIKALPHTQLQNYGGLKAEWNARAVHPEYFLIDTQSETGFGGSGKTFDWSWLRANPLPRPFFLAGGLGPENLTEAVEAARPYAVDLNSRVESAPGIKDVEKIRVCMQQLKEIS